MDQSYYQLTHHLPLDRLVTRALVELEKLGYSRRSLRRYRTIWQHLIEFSVQENLGNEYTENLGARFIEAYSLRNNHVNPQRGWWRHIAFGVKVLAHFACGGRIERSRTDMQKVKIPSAMKKPLRDYEEYCRDRRHLRASTLYERIREIAIFLNFMGLRNLNTLDQIQPVDLTAFITSCAWRITSHAAIKVRGSSRIYRFQVKFGLSAWLSAVSMLILAALFPSSGLGMQKR